MIKKSMFFLMICTSLIYSCTQEKTNETSNDFPYPSNIPTDTLSEITSKQQEAFDALNFLQRQSRGHLYSTFPEMIHPCYPPDSNFVISRTELLGALESLAAEYCSNISLEERTMLAASAVSPLEEYVVLHAYSTSSNPFLSEDPKDRKSRTGIWVMPNILGHRDLVFKW